MVDTMPDEVYYYDNQFHYTPPSDPNKMYYVYVRQGNKYIYGYPTTRRIEELDKKEAEAWKRYNELIKKRKQLEQEGHWKDPEWYEVFKEQQKAKEEWMRLKKERRAAMVFAGIRTKESLPEYWTPPLPEPKRYVLNNVSPVGQVAKQIQQAELKKSSGSTDSGLIGGDAGLRVAASNSSHSNLSSSSGGIIGGDAGPRVAAGSGSKSTLSEQKQAEVVVKKVEIPSLYKVVTKLRERDLLKEEYESISPGAKQFLASKEDIKAIAEGEAEVQGYYLGEVAKAQAGEKSNVLVIGDLYIPTDVKGWGSLLYGAGTQLELWGKQASEFIFGKPLTETKKELSTTEQVVEGLKNVGRGIVEFLPMLGGAVLHTVGAALYGETKAKTETILVHKATQNIYEQAKEYPVQTATELAGLIALPFAGRGISAGVRAVERISPVVEVSELRGIDVLEVAGVSSEGKAVKATVVKPIIEKYKALKWTVPEPEPVSGEFMTFVSETTRLAKKEGKTVTTGEVTRTGTGTAKVEVEPSEGRIDVEITGADLEPVKYREHITTSGKKLVIVGDGKEIHATEVTIPKTYHDVLLSTVGDFGLLTRRTSAELIVKEPVDQGIIPVTGLREAFGKLLERKRFRAKEVEEGLTEFDIRYMEELESRRAKKPSKPFEDLTKKTEETTTEILREAEEVGKRAEKTSEETTKAVEGRGRGYELLLDVKEKETTVLRRYPVLEKKRVGVPEGVTDFLSGIKLVSIPEINVGLELDETVKIEPEILIEDVPVVTKKGKTEVKEKIQERTKTGLRVRTEIEQSPKEDERIGILKTEEVLEEELVADKPVESNYEPYSVPFDVIQAPVRFPEMPSMPMPRGGDFASDLWFDFWGYSEKVNPIPSAEELLLGKKRGGKRARGKKSDEDLFEDLL